MHEESSQNFDRWFNNSQVTNPDGSPKKVYHGTHSNFDAFKRTAKAHLGFHFGCVEAANTRLEDTADARIDHAEVERARNRSDLMFNEYAKYREVLKKKDQEAPADELMAALDRGEDILPILDRYRYKPSDEEAQRLNALEAAWKASCLPVHKLGEGANIGTFYLAIQRPLRLHDVGNWGSPKAIRDALPWHSEASSLGALAQEIQAHRYDGIVYTNTVETQVMRTDSYIAFRPEQIKSAMGNTGVYSPENPDVTDRLNAATRAKDYLGSIRKKVALHA